MAKKYVCPKCLEGDSLATIERLYGSAWFGVHDGEIAWEGETNVDWGGSTTVAVRCAACDWEAAYDEDEDGDMLNVLHCVETETEKEEV